MPACLKEVAPKQETDSSLPFLSQPQETMATSIKVAVTQAEPVWLDLQASIKKAISLVHEAASNGAKIVAFSETWAPGYPAWCWARPVDPVLNTKYAYNSLAANSPEMEQLQHAAKENSIAVVIGYSERSSSGSLYMGHAIISPQGEVVLQRRKIKPTHMERTIFGDGSGPDLDCVAEVNFGPELGVIKVGTLNCWEHAQPLLKFHEIQQGVVIHVAMWPPIDPYPGVDHPGLWSMTADGCQNLSQTFAIESGAYVLHCTAVCNESGIEAMDTSNGMLFREPGGGHSCVIGPDGRRLTQPLGDKPSAEGIVYADLDLTRVVTNKSFQDVVGHYSRPDLIWLSYDKERKDAAVPRN
ncbi:carbon-nitrogen hydrolase [Coniochaeta sp. 2T2.1]|nr:carbon-nitrogen hydrolase [Coniochaeta sp. 2T2.1]